MFFKNHAENKAGKLVPDLFLFFKKALYKLKASGQHLRFNIFCNTLTWTYKRNKPYKIDADIQMQTVDPKIFVIFVFIKGSGTSFSATLCMIFQEIYFAFFILLTGKGILSGSLYVLKYKAICVL